MSAALFGRRAKAFSSLMFQVGSYGGKLKYTISYVSGSRGTASDDGEVQIIVSMSSGLARCFSPMVTCFCSIYWLLNGRSHRVMTSLS